MKCNLNFENSFIYQSFPRIEFLIEISAYKENSIVISSKGKISICNFALDRVINFSNKKNSPHRVQKNDIRLSTPLFCTATNVFPFVSVRHNEIRNTIFILAKFITNVLEEEKLFF